MNVTPEMITALKPNEVFVFGSNLQGMHAGGAAYFALRKFGAINGQGVGLQGQSYAIPTLSFPGGCEEHMLTLAEIKKYVNQFLRFASKNREMFFYVTPIGCGIAGFTPQEIAPLFKKALKLENVALPKSFLEVLGFSAMTAKELRETVEYKRNALFDECLAKVDPKVREKVRKKMDNIL